MTTPEAYRALVEEIRCPYCKAAPGAPCFSLRKRRQRTSVQPHAARCRDAWQRFVGVRCDLCGAIEHNRLGLCRKRKCLHLLCYACHQRYSERTGQRPFVQTCPDTLPDSERVLIALSKREDNF